MKERLLTLVVVFISVLTLALVFECQADPPALPGVSPRAPKAQASKMGAKRVRRLRARARSLGTQHAKDIVFQAQEINMLDPRSDRAKSSRRARQLLDQIIDDPGSVPQEPAPENPTP